MRPPTYLLLPTQLLYNYFAHLNHILTMPDYSTPTHFQRLFICFYTITTGYWPAPHSVSRVQPVVSQTSPTSDTDGDSHISRSAYEITRLGKYQHLFGQEDRTCNEYLELCGLHNPQRQLDTGFKQTYQYFRDIIHHCSICIEERNRRVDLNRANNEQR